MFELCLCTRAFFGQRLGNGFSGLWHADDQTLPTCYFQGSNDEVGVVSGSYSCESLLDSFMKENLFYPFLHIRQRYATPQFSPCLSGVLDGLQSYLTEEFPLLVKNENNPVEPISDFVSFDISTAVESGMMTHEINVNSVKTDLLDLNVRTMLSEFWVSSKKCFYPCLTARFFVCFHCTFLLASRHEEPHLAISSSKVRQTVPSGDISLLWTSKGVYLELLYIFYGICQQYIPLNTELRYRIKR